MSNPRPVFRITPMLAFLLAAIPSSLIAAAPAARGQAMALAAVPDTPLEQIGRAHV